MRSAHLFYLQVNEIPGFNPRENSFGEGNVYLNQKIDLHNLKL